MTMAPTEIDKLIRQNEATIELINNIDRKHELIIKQNEEIIDKQMAHERNLERHYEIVPSTASTSNSSLFSSVDNLPTNERREQGSITTISSTSKRKLPCVFELTQKEFNRKVKSSMMQHIPVNDQHLGMTEMYEKYPDEISRIKASLRNFSPKGLTFNIAWSKALHTFRQQKYMERRLKKLP